MKKVKLAEVKHLIPENCFYRDEDPNASVLYAEGDQIWKEPIDLDEIYTIDDTNDFHLFILINGNLTASQIFNEETDGSTGLVVLGNLTADNIVVGGQGIYVTGDLTVNGLYWGDYNHGELMVEGEIRAKAFVNTDYGVDFQRFRKNDRITIDHLLWDEIDDDYEDKERIQAFLRPEFFMENEEMEEERYSWKEWINDAKLFEALRANLPLLLDSPKPTSPAPQYPFLFDDEAISEKNLSAFNDLKFYAFKESERGEDYEFEYWQDDVLKRIYCIPGQPLSTMVYLQHDEDYACMIYFGHEPTLMSKISGKKEYRFAISYRPDLNKNEWIKLDDRAPQVYRDFLTNQWRNLLHEISEMAYLQNQYDEAVTVEKFDAIMALPTVKRLGTKYYDDNPNSVLFFRGVEWQFRNAGADLEDKDARITIAKPIGEDEDGEDLYEFVHFQRETDGQDQATIVIYTQEENEYDADIYELSVTERTKFKKALRQFQLLNEHIYKTIQRRKK